MADDRGTPPQPPSMRDLLAAGRAAHALSTPPDPDDPADTPDTYGPQPRRPEPGDRRDAA